MGEGSRWLAEGLASDSAPLSPTRAYALNALGVLCMWQGNWADAQAQHQAALAIFEEIADQTGIARTWFRLGFLADKQGNYRLARQRLLQSLRLCIRLGDSWGAELARNRLGGVYCNQGVYNRATSYLERSVRFLRAHGQTGPLAVTLLNMGVLVLEQSLAQTVAHREAQSNLLRQAAAFFHESLTLNQALHDASPAAYALQSLGFIAYLENDLLAAEQHIRAGLELLTSESPPEILFRVFDNLGLLASAQGQGTQAAYLWGAAAAIRTTLGLQYRQAEQMLYERVTRITRKRIGPRAFTSAWTQGTLTSFADLLSDRSAWTLSVSLDHPVIPPESVVEQLSIPPHTPQLAPLVRPSRTPPLRVLALGVPRLMRGEKTVTGTDLVYSKAREMLYYLLSFPHRTREQIEEALWPDASNERQSSFRVIIYHLRRALGQTDWILRHGAYYTVNCDLPLWYDVTAFADALARARICQTEQTTDPAQAIASLEKARALYCGDFLEGMTSEWLLQPRRQLSQQYVETLSDLGHLYFAQQEYHHAFKVFTEAVAGDPYSEAAHRGIIRCYLQMQEYSHAAQYYERVQQGFQRELGTAPAPETSALLDACRYSA